MSHRCLNPATGQAPAPRFPVARPLALAVHLVLLGGVFPLGGYMPAALAQSAQVTRATQRYNIPAGPLSRALTRFSREAGIYLVGAGEAAEGKTCPGLNGSYSVQGGFAALLAGTGLEAFQQGDGSYGLRAAPAAPAAAPAQTEVTLPAVTVTGRADSVPGGLSKPFPGGQVARGVATGVLGQRSLQDLPFAAQSFTSELVSDRQMASPQELAKFNASVNSNFIQGVQGERLTDVNIRGFNANYLIDGVAAPLPTNIFLEPFERIEVIKGVASSALNSLHGTALLNVNLIPKRAGPEPLTEMTLRHYDGSTYGGAIDIGRRFGEDQSWGIRVNAAVDGGETKIKGYELDRRLLHTALDYQGERIRGSLDLQFSRSAPRGFPVPIIEESGLPIPALPDRERTTGQAWTEYPERRQSAIARVEYDLTSQWTAGAVASYGRYKATGAPAGISLLENEQGDTLFVTNVDGNAEAQSRGLQGYLRGTFNIGETVQRLSLVAQRSVEDSDNKLDPDMSCPDNMFERLECVRPPPGPSDGLLLFDRKVQGVVAAYELGLLQDRLLLTAAIRRTMLENRFQNTSTAQEWNFDGSATTPVLGVVVKPMPGLSLFASTAESLEFGAVAPKNAANRDESTAPIAGKQFEIGAKFEGERMGGEIALFDIRRDSAFTDPTTNVFGLFGEQKHRGLEISAFGEVAPGWKLITGATWIDAKYTAAIDASIVGNKVIAVPRFRAVGTLEVDTQRAFGFAHGLSLFSTVDHTGSVPFDTANTRDLPSFTTVDLGLTYATQLADQETTFRMSVRNATDEAYWTTNYIGGDLNPSVPRMVFLSLGVRF